MTEYLPCYLHNEFIQLSNDEIDFCARHGIAMRKLSKARGHRDTQGLVTDDANAIRIQAIGALCEGAICRALGWPLDLLRAQTYGVPDLPGNLQVRQISVEHYGLRVYPKDKPDWRVVGVVILKDKEREPYRLPGWCLVSEARAHPEWEMAPNGRPPMIAVPQDRLRPMSELRKLLKAEGHMPADAESPQPELPLPAPPPATAPPFIHNCPCGQWGAFGYGVSLIRGRTGMWFCFEHRPIYDPT